MESCSKVACNICYDIQSQKVDCICPICDCNDHHIKESCSKVAQGFNCIVCDYNTCKKSSYEKHLSTAKHIKLMASCSKVAQYGCKICDYTTCKKSSYDKHLVSSKHKKLLKSCSKVAQYCENENKTYACEQCDKTYKSYVGLWKHRKTCKDKGNSVVTSEICLEDLTDKNVIIMLVKQNAELLEMVKNGTNNVLANSNINNNNTTTNCINNLNNNSNNNNNNKTFNLNFFLNETCKNAMNISDFIESMQIKLSDLESFGTLGYVESISKIIIKHLKALDETIRPIHCTDKKRETVYVKDEDKWEKDENKTHIRKAINCVANENMKLIPQWKAKNPDYLDSSSIQSDKYNNMVIEVLGGDDESKVSEEKIIRKIAKEIVINK